MFFGKYFPPSMVTKLRNEITNFRQRPDKSLFEAWERYKLSIDRGTFMKRRPKECYDLIENMTTHHNDWDTFVQRMVHILTMIVRPPLARIRTYMLREPIIKVNQNQSNLNQNYQNRNQGNNHEIPHGNNQGRNQFFQGASHGQNPPPAYQAPAYQASGYQAPIHQAPIRQPQVVTTTEFTNYMKANDAILKNMQTNMTSLINSNLELKNMFDQFMKMNTASSLGLGSIPSNTITNPKEDLKGITTQSGNTYKGPTILTTSSPPKVVELETEMNTASSLGLGSIPSNTITNPKEDLKGITTQSGNTYKGPTILTTSSPPKVVELETEVIKDTLPPTNNRSTKDVQPLVIQVETSIPNSESVVAPSVEPVEAPIWISKISFVDALIPMPKFGPTIKSLLTNKEKLYELARTPLNKHCSAVLLKKLPEKLRYPEKFLIACDFLGMDECLALADLGASINIMPLSVWNKLSLPELSPTCMTLELADRSISRPVGVAEDVYVKVGTFYFPTEFVVVDFDADPRVSLILGRSSLKTRSALIDVYEGELTLRVGKEAVTFNVNQISRYSANYDAMLVNQIDLIDVACEEYSQEVLGFSVSGNPTPST
nr:reverse transcriptase domain-containing protein [Tanacetum cinerariifolium]